MNSKLDQTNTTGKTLISDIYKESGIMYIRFDAEIDIKANGQKKIGARRNCVAFSKLEKQPEYKKGDGKYYALNGAGI